MMSYFVAQSMVYVNNFIRSICEITVVFDLITVVFGQISCFSMVFYDFL